MASEANHSLPDYQELLERVYRGPDGPKRVEQIVIRLLT